MSTARSAFRSHAAACSPLCRPVDRADARSSRLVLAVLILVGPLLAGLAGSAAWSRARTSQLAEQAAVFQVDATVRELSPGSSPYLTATWASATWRAPNGEARKGLIVVQAATRTGAVERIWTDDQGVQVPTPAGLDGVVAAAVAAGMGSMLLLGTAAAVVHAQLGASFDRRRYALWDTEWASVEPQWTRRPR